MVELTGDEIEVTRYNCFLFLGRNPRFDQSPMARVVEKQDIPFFGLINHSLQCFLDIGTSGHDRATGFVNQKLNAFRIESKSSYEEFTHGDDIVMTSTKLVGGIRVIAPYKKSHFLASLHVKCGKRLVARVRTEVCACLRIRR